MDFTLRTPAPDDAAELAALHVTTWKQAYGHLLPGGFFTHAHAEGRRALWDRLLADEDPALRRVVAERQGQIVGFALAGTPLPTERSAPVRGLQLFSLYVLASEYGRGVGRELLEAALGSEPALLWVADENQRAIAFYRKHGFEFDGAAIQDPRIPGITDLRMVR